MKNSSLIAIVTGANTGLGLETVKGLAQHGYRVIMACRNMTKATEARDSIINEIPDAQIECMELDLASFESVRTFAQQFGQKFDHLDLLINNAGVMATPETRTVDGNELQLQVNYLSHFLLTQLLFPFIKKGAQPRIVSLSSIAHKNGEIYVNDFNLTHGYKPWSAYGQSKLACLMFAYELQRQIDTAGLKILSVAAHPGLATTELFRYGSDITSKMIKATMSKYMSQSAADGAKPTLMAALDSTVQGGEYFGPDGFMEAKGNPSKVKSTKKSHDTALAQQLWELSEQTIGIEFIIN